MNNISDKKLRELKEDYAKQEAILRLHGQRLPDNGAKIKERMEKLKVDIEQLTRELEAAPPISNQSSEPSALEPSPSDPSSELDQSDVDWIIGIPDPSAPLYSDDDDDNDDPDPREQNDYGSDRREELDEVGEDEVDNGEESDF